MDNSVRGKFGHYYPFDASGEGPNSLVIFPALMTEDWTPNNMLVIPADVIGPFITEIIRMARDLGVTGGEVQGAAV